jgi:ribosomal protein S18 acetylase RimI-like enzyme
MISIPSLHQDDPLMVSSAQFARLAWQNEYTGWLSLGRQPSQSEPSFRMVERAGLACAWWQGPPGEAENYLLASPGYPAPPVTRLQEIRSELLSSENPTILRLLKEEVTLEWNQALASCGFFSTGSDPLMALRLDSLPLAPDQSPELTIRAARSQPDHLAALKIIQAVYQGPPSLTQFFNPSGTVRLYLGLWQGIPAASATLWPFDGIAGVFSVATLPDFRHRGLALAVVRALLEDSHQAGLALATLRTRPELFPLYQRLGFQPVGNIACYYRPLQA